MNLNPPPETEDIQELKRWCDEAYEFLKHPVFGTMEVGDVPSGNYATFANDGELNFAGTGRVHIHIRVGAGSFKLGAAGPTASINGMFSTLAFDKDSDDEVLYTLLVPYRFVTGSEIRVAVDWFYTGAQDNGTVAWGLEYICVGPGETVVGSTTTEVAVSAGTHTTDKLVQTNFAVGEGIIGAHAHDLLGIRLYRDISADTLNTDALLVGAHFEILMDKLGEAT